jgi:hypothetical protein
MSFKKVYGFLFIIIRMYQAVADQAPGPSESYRHFADVGAAAAFQPNQYVLYWKLISNNTIQIESYCKTTGWVGIGVSLRGSMPGADIAIGWVTASSSYLKVRLTQ